MLGDHDDDELARIVDALIQRVRRGEEVDWAAQVRRYGNHAEELKRLGPTLEALVAFLVERGPNRAKECG